jgi:hypothetical protein
MISYAREIMGSLIYATLTRPECKYACSKLSTVVTNPTEKDLQAMERVLQYLYNSRTTKLTYRAGPWRGPDGAIHDIIEPAAYVDASFAQEVGRRSQTGFAVLLAGAAIYCKSGKQTQVTDSTGYAETVALHEASNWVVVLRNTLKKMLPSVPLKIRSDPTLIYEDNAAAITFAAKGPGDRSLHWDVKLEYVHELQNNHIILVVPLDTNLQMADILTKPLSVEQHLFLTKFLLGNEVVFTGE